MGVERMKIRNKTVIIIFAAAIFFITLIIVPLCVRIYNGFVIRAMYSKERMPQAYVLPVERQVKGIECLSNDKMFVFENLQIFMPHNAIIENHDLAGGKKTIVLIDKNKGKGAFINKGTRDEKFSTFESYAKMLNISPDQFDFFKVNFFNDDKEYQEQFQLLSRKSIIDSYNGRIFKFQTNYIKGFQFGAPNEKKNIVELKIFDTDNNQYQFVLNEFSQNEIDCIIALIRTR